MAMPDDLTWVLKHLRARKGLFDLYRDYYRGYHRLAFTTENWRSEFGAMVKGVADNQCPNVVDALVDKLEIMQFTGTHEEQAAAIWKDNRLDLRAGEVHKESARQGDAYLLVWPNRMGEPTFYLNTADQMVVRYSQERPGFMVYAGKVWIGEDERAYATMYYPDRIEKYVTKAKVTGGALPDKGTKAIWDQRQVVVGFEPGESEDDEGTPVIEPWPLENPFGRIPIFHFANDASLGEYGKSELHDVVPLQDILNKDLSDRLITQEFHSFPQRWAVGLEPEYDAEGNAKSPDTGPNRIWFTPSTDGKFGQFDASNLEGFIKVADNDRMEIGRVSRTPIHRFTGGTPPSGEALREMESPLMSKVEDRQAFFGAVWEDAMEFACALPSGDTDGVDLTTEWVDTTAKSDKEKAEEMVMWQTLGVPEEFIWKKMGFTTDEIEEMKRLKSEAEAARADAINSGVNTGFETPDPAVNGTGGIGADVLMNDLTGQ